jgi:hypothetical protein
MRTQTSRSLASQFVAVTAIVVIIAIGLYWLFTPAPARLSSETPPGQPAAGQQSATLSPESYLRQPVLNIAPPPAGDLVLAGASLRIAGSVRDGKNQALADHAVRCEIRRSGSVVFESTVRTDRAGQFLVDAPRQESIATVTAASVEDDVWVKPAEVTLPPRSAEAPYLRLLAFPLDASLRGFVRDAEGPPIPRAQVGVALRDAAAATGNDGGFSLRVASSSRVLSVFAVAEGYAIGQKEVVAPAPGAVAEVEFVLVRGCSLAGRVTDGGGKPVAGARVSTPHTMYACEAITDERGMFALRGLEVSNVRHLLMVNHPQYVPRQVYLVPSTAGFQEIALETGTSLRVTVNGPAGVVPAAKVKAICEKSGNERVGYTDIAGQTDLQALEGGSYTVEVAAQAFAKQLATAQVALGSPASITVVLQRAERVAGRVLDQQGSPCSGLGVVALAGASTGLAGADLGGSTTDDSGRFEIVGLPSGQLRLGITRKGVTLTTFECLAGDTGCVITVAPYAALHARVVAADSGHAIAGAAVRFAKLNEQAVVWPVNPTVVTNADGYWMIDHHVEAAAHYLVEIAAAGYARRLELLEGGPLPAGSYGAGAPRLELLPRVTVAGRLVREGGVPVVGARLSAFSSATSGRIHMRQVAAVDSLSADGGEYRLATVPRLQGYVLVRTSAEQHLLGPMGPLPEESLGHKLVLK